MFKKIFIGIVLLMVIALLAVACGGQTAAPVEEVEAPAGEVEVPTEVAAAPTEVAEEAPAEEEVTSELPKVAMIIAQGGLGDRSYNDLA